MAAMGRSLRRAVAMWCGDEFLARHLLQIVFPPVAPAAAGLLLGAAWAGEAFVLVAAAFGLARRERRLRRPETWLLLVAAAALLVPPILTVGNTRMVLPSVALALPFAGFGVVRWRRWREQPRAVVAAAIVLLAFVALSWWCASQRRATASSHYRPLMQRLDAWQGSSTTYVDAIRLIVDRTAGPRELVLRVGGDYRFAPSGAVETTWRGGGGRRSVVSVVATERAGPLELEIVDAASGKRVRLAPLVPAAWRRPQPTGLPGVRYSWLGPEAARQAAAEPAASSSAPAPAGRPRRRAS
jgi:hypothetical protein